MKNRVKKINEMLEENEAQSKELRDQMESMKSYYFDDKASEETVALIIDFDSQKGWKAGETRIIDGFICLKKWETEDKAYFDCFALPGSIFRKHQHKNFREKIELFEGVIIDLVSGKTYHVGDDILFGVGQAHWIKNASKIAVAHIGVLYEKI